MLVSSCDPEVRLSLRREDGAGEEALRQTVSRVAFHMPDVSITAVPDGSKERKISALLHMLFMIEY